MTPLPLVQGISRIPGYDRALIVSFDRAPTEDELRQLYELWQSPAIQSSEES